MHQQVHDEVVCVIGHVEVLQQKRVRAEAQLGEIVGKMRRGEAQRFVEARALGELPRGHGRAHRLHARNKLRGDHDCFARRCRVPASSVKRSRLPNGSRTVTNTFAPEFASP